jgi:cytochrome b subunit of formate dehydrogenase
MPKKNFNNPNSFPGWRGRSGLDPVDTYRNEAYVEGAFLRRLFTFKLRTRNVISLITMLIFGLAVTGLILFFIIGAITTPLFGNMGLEEYLLAIPFCLMLGLVLFIGLALLINFSINVGIISGLVRNKSVSQNTNRGNRKTAKKKIPKRRKDYR